MASLGRPSLLPQCIACTRRTTWLAFPGAGAPLQHVRNKTKAAREAERNIVVKLLKDVNKFGRAGSYVPLNPGRMRNKWYPMRVADYVPVTQLKQLKAEGVSMERDVEFGVERPLQEEDEGEILLQQSKPYVRPVEIDFLSPERSMELLTTFVPNTIEFARQAIEQARDETTPHHGASDAADILTAAAMASKPKTTGTGIYGSVSTADVVATIKAALAHNDEAARVLLSESDVHFVDVEGIEGDSTRVRKLGNFKVEIQVSGAEAPIIRTVRVRAKKE